MPAGGDAAGDRLVVSGNTTIDWDVVGAIVAKFSGGLDCGTGAFRVEDSTAAFSVGGLPAGTCDVTFTGSVDPATRSLSGQYTLSNCSDGSWSGTWTTTLTP